MRGRGGSGALVAQGRGEGSPAAGLAGKDATGCRPAQGSGRTAPGLRRAARCAAFPAGASDYHWPSAAESPPAPPLQDRTMPNDHLQISRQGDQVRIMMARPAERNAFNQALIAELTEAFHSLADAPGARLAVLGGEGDIFSAGADVDWMRSMGSLGVEENVADAHRLADLFQSIRDCPLPVIARVQGAAMGGGAGLVAACDLAVAAEGTRFAFSEARLGIVPAVISPFVMSKIGPGPAREFFLTGETFDAARAREIGLVGRVVPLAELDAAVEERAAALRAAGPEAQAAIKRLVPMVLAANSPAAMRDATTRLIAERRASAEGREGLGAFLERRRPGWAG